MIYTSMADYMREKVGRNWVISRRTPRIVAQYGEDVVCISPKEYKSIQVAFNAQAPSIENAARAMLAALQRAMPHFGVVIHSAYPGERDEIRKTALEAIAQAKAAGIKVQS